MCVPLAAESYCAWRFEVQDTFARLPTRLAIKTSQSKSKTDPTVEPAPKIRDN